MGRNRKKKLSPVQVRNRRSKARGRYFEEKTARDLDGYIFTGQAGDVQYMGPNGYIRGECKYRSGLDAYGQLKEHIDQAIRNVDGGGQPWTLHLTGGKPYRNAQSFTVLPTSLYKSLLDRVKEVDQGKGLSEMVRQAVREELDESS